jgi:hypothetical protein
MAWNGRIREPFERFNPAHAYWPPRNERGVLWGDQEHLSALRDAGLIDWTPIAPELVKSYKYHCRNKGLPNDCRVVVFHGDPKPAEVSEPWLKW